METRITYVGTLNGINGLWCGFCPDGVIVNEERKVLYPAKNHNLKRLSTGEIFTSVWLQDNDVPENYKEIIAEQEEENES